MFAVCRTLSCVLAVVHLLNAAPGREALGRLVDAGGWVPRSAVAQAPDVWTPIGPAGATIFVLQRDPFDARSVLAGTYFGGLYRSVDNGSTWANVAGPFSSHAVFSIVFDPKRAGVIYVGTFEGGVFRTDDGGRNWTSRNTGLLSLEVQAIGIDPFRTEHLLAATSRGIFTTEDSGETWRPTDGTGLIGRSIAFDPRRNGTVYVGTLGQAVHQSVDAGATWQRTASNMKQSNVLSLAFDATGALFAATSDGVYRRNARSEEWLDLTGSLNRNDLFFVLPHPKLDDVQFVAANSGVFMRDGKSGGQWTRWSELPARLLLTDSSGGVLFAAAVNSGGLRVTLDKGKSWVDRNEGFQNIFIGALAGSQRGGDGLVHAGSDFGVYSASARANMWTRPASFGEGIFSLIRADASGTLFAGTERAGVWKSTDFGETWKSSSLGIAPPQIFAIRQGTGSSSDVLYAGTSTGIYVSRNRGEKWLAATTLASAFTVEVDQNVSGRVLFGSFAGQVLQSLDHGQTFQSLSDGLPAETILDLDITFDRSFAVTSSGSIYMLAAGSQRWALIRDASEFGTSSIAADPKQPWIVYTGTNGGGVYKSTSAGIEWTRSSEGMENAFVSALAVSPFDSSTIFAGAKGMVFRSDTSGSSWASFAVGLPDSPIQHFAFGPTGILYAGTADAGTFRSTDRGETWELVGASLPNVITALCVDSVSGDLIAGTKLSGIYRSKDEGSWKPSSDGLTLFIRGLAVGGGPERVLYAGALLGGIFRSDDEGASWRSAGLSETSIFKVAIDPQDRNTVYAATAEGIKRTRNGGDTWTSLGQRAAFVLSMAGDPRNRDIVYVGTTAGNVSRTRDGGRTWEALAKLPPFTVMALAIDPVSGTLYAMLEKRGLYRSTDDGKTWTLHASTEYLYGHDILRLFIHQETNTLYGATQGGVLRSEDGGATWLLLNQGLTSTAVSSVIADNSIAGRLLLSTFDAGVWVSSDGGQSWTSANDGLDTPKVNEIVQSLSASRTFYALTANGIYRSLDATRTWARLAEGPSGAFLSLHIDPSDSSRLFAGSENDGVWRSSDGGENWVRVNGSLKGVSFLAPGAESGTVYAGTQNAGVVRSSDGGSTWTGDTNPDVVNPIVLSMALHPQQPNVIYAGTAGQGILKSTNGGQDWTLMNDGLTQRFVLSLAIDPQNGDRLYAGTSGGGVFTSNDGGAKWRPLNDRLYSRIVTALAVDAMESNVIYAGTEGGGVYRLVRSAPSGSGAP